MRHKGRVREWRDDKGFGFIEPMLPGPAVFVHIKAFARSVRRPIVGDLLTYELGRDQNGRPRAARVAFSLDSPEQTTARSRSGKRAWAIPLAALTLLGLGAAWFMDRLPAEIVGVYAATSLITYFLYAWDKVAAKGGRHRTAENTLLLAGLVGGWPGALIAQETMRHKTAKDSFQASFWFTVSINVAALTWAWSTGFEVLNRLMR